jgi:hypothetical protein
LHDWSGLSGWEGVHDVWIVELLRAIKSQLPDAYRAYIGSAPALAIGTAVRRPDVAVRPWRPEPPPDSVRESLDQDRAGQPEPDEEVATLALDPQTAVFVTAHGRLVAAAELVSPPNKDRPASRATYLARYLSYLHEGAHLLLVDVHPHPLKFSFADALAEELQIRQPACAAPCAVAYRVGEPASQGGRMLAIWRRAMAVGHPLPVMPLPLTVHLSITVDLERTYQQAAADAYLE